METKWNQGKMPMTSTLTSMGILPSADNVRKKTKKVPDASHGLKFESKLLTLFCIRALEAGCKFEVTKEREDLGGKFDDVIFRYLVVDDTLNGKPWRYRYLQAKHRQEESFKINGTHLLEDNEKGHFSLPKYFRSFCKMRTRCEDIHDCILCTNGGFDLKDVQEKGIELVSINDQPEDILEFGPQQKTARYKLEFSKELRGKALCDWSDIDRLAKQLQVCAQDQTTTDIRSGVFSSYHLALVNEHVIDSATKTFHVDFLNNAEDLSNGAQHLRQTISNLAGYDWKKWKFELSNTFGKSQTSAEMENCLPLKITEADIDTYLDKVVFVVNMPNEKEFEDILQVEDVNKYYPREECSIQTVRLLHEMSAKFSNKVMGYWLTSEDAKKILLAGVTNVSQQYQEELENDMAFNEVAKQDMAVKLKDLLANNERIERIITRSPKHTAVKVVSAIHKLAEYNRNGSFLVVTLSSLEDKERWRNILKLKTDSHHLLIVVCDKETPDPCDYADLVPHDQINNKIMFICRDRTAGMMDEITYADMSEKFQNAILQKTISFQGTKLTVDELVVNEPDKVIDCLSIEELLLQEKKEINIPQPDTYDEESVYIKRWLTIAFNEAFDTKLANRLNCTIDELH
ncbi:uncharacterized protein LOC130702731 [Daphnia carinata]|uniref:uncharacterized protein LOC130702731 n=1 Tax=Daphnia carinata TaxID=120202 RepID=UPI00257CD7E2|nr:uncharacterized protein LOC130702731 [Daphnia carinata]